MTTLPVKARVGAQEEGLVIEEKGASVAPQRLQGLLFWLQE